MDARLKQQKDRNRAQKAMRKKPDILAIMLSEGFAPDGTKKVSMRKIAERMDKKKSWLGTSLLKQLVGQGYLRPQGESYAITQKGKALILPATAPVGTKAALDKGNNTQAAGCLNGVEDTVTLQEQGG